MLEDLELTLNAMHNSLTKSEVKIRDLERRLEDRTQRWCRASTIAKLFDLAPTTVGVIAGDPKNNIRVMRADMSLLTKRQVVRISYDDFLTFMLGGGVKINPIFKELARKR